MARSIVDVHAHVGTSALLNGQSVDDYIGLMDRFGIGQALLSHVAGGLQIDGLQDTIAENNLLLAAARRHPERFPTGFASFEARHGEQAAQEVDRAIRSGLCGIAHHAWFQTGRVGNTLRPVVEAVAARRGVCFIHSMPGNTAQPEAFGRLARDFPDALFIMGHPSMAQAQHEEAIAVARQHENVYLDVVVFNRNIDHVTDYVRALGHERILFGSDTPFGKPEVILPAVEEAGISDAAKEAILYENGKRLIEIIRERVRRD
jgi:predicted TIM-barrel fold metal-dependent hydrolase